MLMMSPVREILQKLHNPSSSMERDALLANLVRQLANTFRQPPSSPQTTPHWQPGARYPTDAEGYAVAFDPVTESEAFLEHWNTYGMVVGKNVVAPEVLDAVRARMHGLTAQLSEGACDLGDPATYKDIPQDANGTQFISRGFYELYHDAVLAEVRESPAMYIHHALIWQRADLWTSFDRLGFKLPEHESAAGLPMHVDQNPLVHPDFKTVQGVLALEDCPLERGTFVGVPTSRALFGYYGQHATNQGEYVELPVGSALHETLAAHAQPIPLRKGCLVSWDSRTTHANSTNLSRLPRYVMYVAAGPAREDKPELAEKRREGFESGEGSNVREALMHASKKPRYTNLARLAALRQPEQLSVLGKLLYGFDSYKEIADAPAA